MLDLELVTYVYESEVCMRGNILGGAHGRVNGQFNALLHRDAVWPKLLVFVIVIFYATIFALFALSYAYIFSGLWGNGSGNGSGSGSVPVRMAGDDVNVLKGTTLLPQNITASLDANVSKSSAPAPATQTNVRVNGSTVSVPNNGSVHKEISTGSGNASIDVSVQSNGSSDSESSSSIDLSVSSSSHTAGQVQQ